MACKAFHKGKYYISFKRGFDDCKKDVTVTIDKLFESDKLRITLSDDEDPTFLCVLNITRMDYEDLKKQQGLLVDFDNFPSQLVRLLQQCASNNMFLIMQQKNPAQFYFEVVEHNEFKRLIHLSLKTGPATDADIREHMANTINYLKKTLALLKSSATNTEALLNDKCINLERRIHDYTHNITRIEEEKKNLEIQFKESLTEEKNKIIQEKQIWQENAELNMKSQISLYQDNLNKKEKQIDEMTTLNKHLRDKIGYLEAQLNDKGQRLDLLETEVQKSHIEVATLKARNVSLERDIVEKDRQCNQLSSKCVYLDKNVKDNTDVIKDLNDTVRLLRKEKQILEDRLALSESLVTKNNDAVQSTSEQLLKANQIISKQNADLIEMKEKLLCRTAIALEQEKVVERNKKKIEELMLELSNRNQNMDKLQKEFDELKEKHEANERSLKERDETIKNNNMVIQWLHKKLDHLEPTEALQMHHKIGIETATSSTPYFITKNNNHTDSIHAISEESIDFYATSKSRSNLEESPGPDIQKKYSKVGLDPKYLQPVDSGNKSKPLNTKDKRTSNVQIGKGKENINLPKVNYREKKSSRGSTYRVTPVSAYFP